MNIPVPYLYLLGRIRSAEKGKINLLLEKEFSLEALLEAFPPCSEVGALIRNEHALSQAEREIQMLALQRISVMTFFAPGFPEDLRQIPDPPLVLFVRGGTFSEVRTTPCIAIVGSRNCNTTGVDTAIEFARFLSDQGICTVSGLALGIDTAAHEGALQVANALPTIAVLGSAVTDIYPPRNKRLAERIIEAGGIVTSPFYPDEKPLKHHFLSRNRLIAALSLGTVVVQAALRSGALSTARFAAEIGREVMGVPGSIFDPRHEGTNHLIQQGAHLVRNPQDILEICIPGWTQGSSKSPVSLEAISSSSQKLLLEIIREQGPIHMNQLLAHEKTLLDLHGELIELECSGYISRLPGNLFQVRART